MPATTGREGPRHHIVRNIAPRRIRRNSLFSAKASEGEFTELRIRTGAVWPSIEVVPEGVVAGAPASLDIELGQNAGNVCTNGARTDE
jgi:hypothetical protein